MTTTTTVKKIGPVLATFMVANNMIGSGFFLLPATLAKAGTVTALSWLIATPLAVALGAAFARIARQHPDPTSPDDYVLPPPGRAAGVGAGGGLRAPRPPPTGPSPARRLRAPRAGPRHGLPRVHPVLAVVVDRQHRDRGGRLRLPDHPAADRRRPGRAPGRPGAAD